MKTTEQRIEEIVSDVGFMGKFSKFQQDIFKGTLEALVLSAKLDQLKESK